MKEFHFLIKFNKYFQFETPTTVFEEFKSNHNNERNTSEDFT